MVERLLGGRLVEAVQQQASRDDCICCKKSRCSDCDLVFFESEIGEPTVRFSSKRPQDQG